MAVIDTGTSTAGKANVDANFNLNVVLPTTKAQAGFAALAGRNDDGVVTGAPLTNRIYVSEGLGGIQTAIPVPLWDDTFNATAQNTSNYRTPNATATTTFAGGTVNLVGTTTSGNNCCLQTNRTFPFLPESDINIKISGYLTVAPQTNNVVEIGLFTATLAGSAAPTDGVFFRWNASAELRGVINFNGVETQTAAITSPSITVAHDFLIVVDQDVIRFYIDQVLQASISTLSDAPTQGQAFSQGSLPLTLRNYNTGAVSSAQTFKCNSVLVTLLGGSIARTFGETSAGMGRSAYQGQNGNTQGTTAQLVNNTLAAAAVPTNTTAALGTGLGGHFNETVTLAQGTDGIIQSFQNPVGSTIITPRNLVIYGVTITGIVHTVLAATIWNAVMYLAYGHTAVSLATAESATGTSPATKAPRRVALPGAFSLAASAAAGTVLTGQPINVRFISPIIVAPGEFVAVVSRKITAAPASGAVYWTITYDAYFE
jgi:hypothetical protein